MSSAHDNQVHACKYLNEVDEDQDKVNRANVFGEYYDSKSQSVKYWQQAPLIPVLSYRVEF